MNEVERSYEYCRRIARSRAKNFYYSFILLTRQQRKAMCAIYAFMRHCDDLSDEPGASREALERWRGELAQSLDGRMAEHPLWPAFCHTVRRFGIPSEYFHEMIDGVLSDLQPRRFQTFQELYRYCYQVASVVGLTCIHIFGFDTKTALPLAEKCGVAFQMTNILRDIREDQDNGRIYLPAEDLARFHVMKFEYGANFTALMSFESHRAESYYEESRPLLGMVDRRSQASLWALMEIYHRLLKRIEKSGFRVLDQRVSVPAWEKLSIVGRAFTRKLL